MAPWLAAILLSHPFSLQRDSYGVAQVSATAPLLAYEGMGYAVAQDRLWQLELSRRIARGTMSETFGKEYVASDSATFKLGYSDQELEAMLGQLGQDRSVFSAYTKGINRSISERRADQTLPPEYAKNGFQPSPWTELDSAAICVRMARLFGNGGEGELRNLLLTYYLKGQPVGEKYLDAVDDLAWFNDPDSPVTADVPRPAGFLDRPATRTQTTTQLKEIPGSSLFELLPAVRLAAAEDSRLVAEAHGIPFKTGSYAMLVSKGRSLTPNALLLGGPQMGHTIPSVVHEVSLLAPGLAVTGMDVPGIPGVLIGKGKSLAWTLTSGVADMTDIVYYRKSSAQHDPRFVTEQGTIKVKGDEPVHVTRTRSAVGPVVLDSKIGNAIYVQRSALWKKEFQGYRAVWKLPLLTSARAATKAMDSPLSFNFFVADSMGNIGWKYCGAFYKRAPGYDSRFPVPVEATWQPYSQSINPVVLNPKDGLLTNWNNKPVKWWPNWDTPVWGKHFRVAALRQSLPPGKLTLGDLEKAATKISQRDEGSWTSFMPLIRRGVKPARYEGNIRQAASLLLSYDGWNTVGSKAAVIYAAFISQLKQEVFTPLLGTFMSPQNMNLIIQTSPLDRAINRRTRLNYLGNRSPEEVVASAFEKAARILIQQKGAPSKWSYNPGGIRAPDGSLIPYGNRGTFIEVIELNGLARSVAGPGVSEYGPHSTDQVQLNRDWSYKPMWRP